MSNEWTMQLIGLATGLPAMVTMMAVVAWSLLRLHARPRAGWTMLVLVALWGFVHFGMSAIFLLFNLTGNGAGVVSIQAVYLISSCMNFLLNAAMWGWVGYEFWRIDPDNHASLIEDKIPANSPEG
ncbi:hypothetical protein GC163_13710 [bacterium]|nr:hypothetical protein [bacterium]